jgi:hypothetical protein
LSAKGLCNRISLGQAESFGRARSQKKIEAVEAAARAMGWPPELLWNSGFWDCRAAWPRCSTLRTKSTKVTADYIAVLKTRRDLLRFRRYAA